MIIYKIINKINRKIYIGITTKSLNKRVSAYKSQTKSSRPANQSVIAAMKKYGFENFIFEQIDSASSKEELKKKEIEYIRQFNSTDTSIGYNISIGGDLPSESTLKKKSDKLKGKSLSEDHKRKISESLKGHKMPENVQKALVAARKGKPSWNARTVGIVKANSGSFSVGPRGTRRKSNDLFS